MQQYCSKEAAQLYRFLYASIKVITPLMAALRLSAHNLEIERGRHLDVPRENRKCRLCSMGMVESEYHFILVCPLYSELSNK